MYIMKKLIIINIYSYFFFSHFRYSLLCIFSVVLNENRANYSVMGALEASYGIKYMSAIHTHTVVTHTQRADPHSTSGTTGKRFSGSHLPLPWQRCSKMRSGRTALCNGRRAKSVAQQIRGRWDGLPGSYLFRVLRRARARTHAPASAVEIESRAWRKKNGEPSIQPFTMLSLDPDKNKCSGSLFVISFCVN